ncbi:MAG TPA: competence/damage-inducible protein A [Polyangiaceae bacterium]|nr:competence/damage-inducible protein A [Polyangiaceae bacterium]
MTAAVLCTGTELTRGELFNSNATYLAEALTALGFEVGALDAVDDDDQRIVRALERLGKEHDVLVCTGGLGPTTDDLTSECVARVLGVPLERDETSLEAIRRRVERVGRTLTASNAKQANFPRGASILPNPNGTAPGFSVKLGRAAAFFLPGVPLEMKAMFAASVVPAIQPLVADRSHQTLLRTFGLPESEVNDRLAGLDTAHDVTIGYRARLPEIEVKLLARAPTADAARARAAAAAAEVRARLGLDVVYGEGDTSLPEVVCRLLEAQSLTLALAESCTGGMVAELVTNVPGASRSFLGGVVAYSNAAKTELLGVDPTLIERHGAVSAEVARALAEGARRRFGSDLALAVTGIAGPDGGTPEKPVGLVHWAAASDAGIEAKHAVFSGNREQVRRRSAYAALALLRRVVLRSSVQP